MIRNESSVPDIPTSMLSRYRHCDPIRPPVPQSGGFSGAGVWKVETTDGAFCLRAWPRSSASRERIVALHRLLTHVRGAGVKQVAVPLAGRDGLTVQEHQGRLWQLEPWMPGVADFRDSPSDARLRSAMRILAKWHLAARSFCPHSSESTWFFCAPQAVPYAVSTRLTLIRQIQESSPSWSPAISSQTSEFRRVADRIVRSFRRLQRDVAAQLDSAQKVPARVQPCLRDVWHDHVLFTGDDVTGLIDPAAARTDTIAADLSRLLGSFLGSDATRWRFALDEYFAHNPLTSDEMRLVPILDLSGVLLSGARWLDRILVQNEPIERPVAVLERLTQIADRLDTFPT